MIILLMRHGMKVVWKLVKSKHNLESVKCLREREREMMWNMRLRGLLTRRREKSRE